MQIPLYQVDAFADRPFTGNPAAICPLDAWLDDGVMQSIALENNLSETAFLVGGDGVYDLRWFTPVNEVNLCGHATLASAYVVFTTLEPDCTDVRFSTRSGDLMVRRDGDRLTMSFPAIENQPIATPAGLADAIGAEIEQALTSHQDMIALVANAETVRTLQPDFSCIAKNVSERGLIVTAPGNENDDFDFVSRFFAPAAGIDEDSVTGSAHCQLAPYWAGRLGKETFIARQLSPRGGTVYCRLDGDRVMLSGTAIPYLQGTISI